MGNATGRVIEIRLDASGQMGALIACTEATIPHAGQYLVAADLRDLEAPLGTPLFLEEHTPYGFWSAPPIPSSWRPGTSLALSGPLGHGFDVPRDIRRLGLVALGETAMRLMPLVRQALQGSVGITLFTDQPLPVLPASVEAYPLASLAEMLDWPDFVAVDLQQERLAELRSVFGLQDGSRLPFPAQVLVTATMPCAGVARCGACAVPTRRGWKLSCEDGPVFDIHLLQW
jgi:Iron-sulfur cluster binding domain of dihydroorotate dehydrogenase B